METLCMPEVATREPTVVDWEKYYKETECLVAGGPPRRRAKAGELRVFMEPGLRPLARDVLAVLRHLERRGSHHRRTSYGVWEGKNVFVVTYEDDSPLEDGYVRWVPRRGQRVPDVLWQPPASTD